ncbi:hypothetical protein HYH02_005978 [Chlamydomonas schloesseri]|uniref:Homoserine dehydrogenase n=1 Tax=Chlamydomonas schloesseri TaxID=2026947 RepID=A0A835WKG3_9CHLO|nr:hypothetical protein HYH02_005978 [Chlamydomonas schloesseri]|eukprot:KAG2449232.1 hypothetical protein HYH02_005978 [Chlamydomonas schloesseri]
MSVDIQHQPLSVSVGLIGPGLIGKALLRQIEQQAEKLLTPLHADKFRVVAVANSRQMLLRPEGVNLATWETDLAEKGEPLDLDRYAACLASASGPLPASLPGPSCSVLVDCTASDAVSSRYAAFMRQGLHIVTPNKKFGAGPLKQYHELRDLAERHRRRFMYEATVGAGLPVISTLHGLLETGDKIIKIEGILSGTLSYIFNTYKPGMKFSDVVADAKAKGYTEPDPRDDLSGLDVARKVVILARECGMEVELESMAVESLVPAALRGEGVSAQQYMEALPQHDGDMAAKAAEADAAGGVVRYVGCVDAENGTASVTLRTYPAGHPFAQLSGSDNIVVFTTERYKDRPLIVRGPGAGADVTAAGVFVDLLQVVRSHPRA